jgi:hypothetical protein
MLPRRRLEGDQYNCDVIRIDSNLRLWSINGTHCVLCQVVPSRLDCRRERDDVGKGRIAVRKQVVREVEKKLQSRSSNSYLLQSGVNDKSFSTPSRLPSSVGFHCANEGHHPRPKRPWADLLVPLPHAMMRDSAESTSVSLSKPGVVEMKENRGRFTSS